MSVRLLITSTTGEVEFHGDTMLSVIKANTAEIVLFLTAAESRDFKFWMYYEEVVLFSLRFLSQASITEVLQASGIVHPDLFKLLNKGKADNGGYNLSDPSTFGQWLAALYYVTACETGRNPTEIQINEGEALKWFENGATPYQCFRETWDIENDSE